MFSQLLQREITRIIWFLFLDFKKRIFELNQQFYQNYPQYNKSKENSAVPMKENTDPQLNKEQQRDYKCPCGKTYLSYPALFTHIKYKHNGKAPGNIEKPSILNKTRGRPPLAVRSSNSINNEHQNHKDSKQKYIFSKQQQRNRIYWQEFSEIFPLIRHIDQHQPINYKIWQKLQTFQLFENFIESHQISNSQFNKNCLGNTLSEFLKSISLSSQGNKFQQILLIFISLLEYISRENSKKNIITESSVDILIEYMNPFISLQLENFAVSHEMSYLWIMQKQNAKKIFKCFYSWLKWKDYTKFCITLIQ